MSNGESARILKANDLRSLGSRVAFNYEDLRRRCDEHIEKVRGDARRLLEDAQAEAETMRQQAQTEGAAAGRRDGLQQAEDEIARRSAELAEKLVQEKLRTVLPALQAATQSLAQERDRWLAEWESVAVGLSVAIAEKLLRNELSQRPQLARDMIVQTLELAAGNPQIRLHLHPDDLELLGTKAEDVVRSVASCGTAILVPDDAIDRGGCVVETQHGTLDARLETQLARITAELLQTSP